MNQLVSFLDIVGVWWPHLSSFGGCRSSWFSATSSVLPSESITKQGASCVTLPCSLSRWHRTRATCSLLGCLLYFLHEAHWAFSHLCPTHKSWSPCLFQCFSLAPESTQVWPYLTVGQIEEVSLIHCIWLEKLVTSSDIFWFPYAHLDVSSCFLIPKIWPERIYDDANFWPHSAFFSSPNLSGNIPPLPDCCMLLLLLSRFSHVPTLCDPIDGSPPGSPVPGILQARTLERIAISFSNAWKWSCSVVFDS